LAALLSEARPVSEPQELLRQLRVQQVSGEQALRQEQPAQLAS
jgi:hypothetical protein